MGDAIRRTVPAGFARSWPTSSGAGWMSWSAGRSCASRRSPAFVGATERVVRARSLSPSRSSSVRIEWLIADLLTPRFIAAFVKLRSSATAANAARTVSSSRGYRMAHPSAGSDTDHHCRLRARAELGWSSQSDSTGRRHLVPAGREALAWRDADHRHDSHRNPGTPPRQGRQLDGEGQRRTIPGACRGPEVGITMRSHHVRRRANVTASQKVVSTMKIRLKVGATPLTAALFESEASRDFASLLPLTLTMNDLFRREEYGHLPRPIAEEGRRGHTYEIGQIPYWAPGPDVAVYYRQDGQPIPDPGIVVLGTINCGVEAFDVPGATRVTIELVK